MGYVKEVGRQHEHVRGKGKERRGCQRVMAMCSFLGTFCYVASSAPKRENSRNHQASRPHKLRQPGAGSVNLALRHSTFHPCASWYEY